MKIFFLNIALLILLKFSASAQPFSACFNANVVRGCAPLTVTMNDCSGSPNVFYKYTPSSGYTTTTTHTYNTPGFYTISQTVDNGIGTTDNLVKTNYIEVLAPKKPTINLDVCAGKSVTLTVTDNIDTAYYVNFGDGSGNMKVYPNIGLNHIYANTLIKTITITPTSVACSITPADTTFYPIDLLVKPDISKLTVNNQNSSAGQITLQFTALINQRYYLQESINNNTSYVTIKTLKNISGVQNIILNNLNTQSNQYCYRIISYDDCGATIPSEEICSNLVTVTAVNQGQINWMAHIPGNVLTYHVYKNNVEITTTSLTSYTDNAVNCGVNYCYYIVAELNSVDGSGNNLLSISDDQCVVATSNNIPTAIQNLNSTVGGNEIDLSWDIPISYTVANYQILRSVNGATYSSYATSSSNSFNDGNVTIPGNTYCYMVNYSDVCGNISASGTSTCPVILDLTIDPNDNMTNHLTWTAYTGSWPLGINGYVVEKLDENNNVISSTTPSITFNLTDVIANTNLQVIRYRIKVLANGSSAVSYSNIVEIKYEGVVFLPNAFTPDGDGLNDIFLAKGKFIKDFKMTIFNRWGEVVYISDKIDNGWDGNYQGLNALNDAYAYLVEATDLWGKKITKRGSVTLLK